MNNIHQVLAFATAARNGSFAKAARELSQTPSTIAKSIGRLESQLGVRLFNRTTRQVSLTPDGQQLFEQCQRILEEVELLKSAAAGASGAPTGVLRIEVPITYGRRVVVPVLARLLERHPGLSIDARLSDDFSDVIREGLDAVVRIATAGRLAAGRENHRAAASRRRRESRIPRAAWPSAHAATTSNVTSACCSACRAAGARARGSSASMA